jgi:hypothetical protein
VVFSFPQTEGHGLGRMEEDEIEDDAKRPVAWGKAWLWPGAPAQSLAFSAIHQEIFGPSSLGPFVKLSPSGPAA